MRDINRIDKFASEMSEVWKKSFPDWRFGQFILNFLNEACDKHGDPFFWEEDRFLEYLHEFAESFSY